jgi:hypothetical protein
VTIFDLTMVAEITGGEAKDLNDLLRLVDTEPLKNYPALRKIIPIP